MKIVLILVVIVVVATLVQLVRSGMKIKQLKKEAAPNIVLGDSYWPFSGNYTNTSVGNG